MSTAKILLDHNANVNATTRLKATSLIAAASHGHAAVVRMLLTAGADREMRVRAMRARCRRCSGLVALNGRARARDHGLLAVIRALRFIVVSPLCRYPHDPDHRILRGGDLVRRLMG